MISFIFSFAALMNSNLLQEVAAVLWAHESLYHRKSASSSLCKLRIKKSLSGHLIQRLVLLWIY